MTQYRYDGGVTTTTPNAMFAPASKEAAKLRAAIFGPSGAGKTFTALRIATGIGGPIALIDSERRTASKYADRFSFDVANLESSQHRIADYVAFIRGAASSNYNVLIIDSLTHAWQQLLTEIDALAKAKYRGNTWSAWSEGTPQQRALVDAILDFPGHVIATMRSKTEWTTEKDVRGRDKPVRVGLSPEQGKGIEYEFDMLFEMSVDHILTVIKDRSGKFQDLCLPNPGEELGQQMAAWLSDGALPVAANPAPAPAARQLQSADLLARALMAVTRSGLAEQALTIFLEDKSSGKYSTLRDLPIDWLEKLATRGIAPADVTTYNERAEALTVAADDEPPATWAGSTTTAP